MAGGPADLKILDTPDRPIAFRRREGASPTLLFLPGYGSDMEGAKALALDEFAMRQGIGMVRFDYSGTGSSAGRFEDGTLARWLQDAAAVLDELTAGPVILVGSSMGGWLALHLALQHPSRIAALVGIAAAPDFTEWGFTPAQKAELQANGRIVEGNPYGPEPSVTTRDFWESGQALRLLDHPIAIDCPVRLIHGEEDKDVPLNIALWILRQLRSGDVQLLTIKGGGHRLSEPHEIDAILRTVASLLEPAS